MFKSKRPEPQSFPRVNNISPARKRILNTDNKIVQGEWEDNIKYTYIGIVHLSTQSNNYTLLLVIYHRLHKQNYVNMGLGSMDQCLNNVDWIKSNRI